MKENLKLIGIIALAAVIGLGMVSCNGEVCDHLETTEEIVKPVISSDGITDGSKKVICSNAECGEVVSEEKIDANTVFFGRWEANDTTNKQRMVIESGKFTFSSAAGASVKFTIDTWGDVVKSSASGGNFASGVTISKTDYPVGYRLKGTSTESLGSGFAGNTYKDVGVYINTAGKKIIIQFTTGTTDANTNFQGRTYEYDIAESF